MRDIGCVKAWAHVSPQHSTSLSYLMSKCLTQACLSGKQGFLSMRHAFCICLGFSALEYGRCDVVEHKELR